MTVNIIGVVKSGCKMILPPKARIQLMVVHGILAPNDCRICSVHLRDELSEQTQPLKRILVVAELRWPEYLHLEL